MFKKIKYFILVVLTGLILYSCASEICNQQMTSYLKVNFYNRTTKKDSAIGYLTVISLNSLQKDSLYILSPGDSTILLPLSTLKDTTSSSFYIEMDTLHATDTIKRNDTVINILYNHYPIRKDTLVVNYKRTNTFVSYECGFRPDFNLSTVSLYGKWTTDSLVISQPTVTTNNEINYKIYLKPTHN